MGDRDAARHVFVVQDLRAILHRLRPAGGRRVLRTDAAARRQHARTVTTGQIEYDADVATLADVPERIMVEASASSTVRPRASINGRER